MTDPEPVPEEVERWLRYAREDLDTAGVILEHGGVPRAACFHAQQAVEKAIKASLIFSGIGFRKTHDLESLASTLPEGWSVGEDAASLADLTVWAVEPRYPGDLPEATKEDAEAAVEQARKVHARMVKDLEDRGHGQEDAEASAGEPNGRENG
jgi:HEPN domain-containing protein